MNTLFNLLVNDFKSTISGHLIEGLIKNKDITLKMLKKVMGVLKEKDPQNYLYLKRLIVSIDRPLHPNVLKGLLDWTTKSMTPNQYINFFPGMGNTPLDEDCIDFVVITLTSKCNLKCRHCYGQTTFNNDSMDYGQAQKLIRQILDMKVYQIVLTGGEPFLWPRLFDLINEFPEAYFIVCTNGTFMDAASAVKAVSAGNCSFAVSVEGFEKETDSIRGTGVYKKVKNTFSLMRDHGLFFGYQTTVMRENQDTAVSKAFIDEMIKSGCALGIYYLYMPVSAADDCSKIPDFEAAWWARKYIRDSLQHHDIVLEDIRFDAFWPGECVAAAKKFVHVTVDGYVEPCHAAHYATHNIRDHSFEEIMDSEFFRMIRNGYPGEKLDCMPCTVNYSTDSINEFKKETGAIATYPFADEENPHLREVLDKFHFAVRKQYSRGPNGIINLKRGGE